MPRLSKNAMSQRHPFKFSTSSTTKEKEGKPEGREG